MDKSVRSVKENIVHLSIWIILIIAPIVTMYIQTTQQEDFDFRWADVFYVWKIYLIFFIPFLIHNFFIAPLLVYRHRPGLFFLLLTTLLAIFFATQHAIKEQGNTGKKMENATCYDLIQNVTTSRQETNNHAKYLINPHQYPPTLFQQTDIVYTFILFLMLGMNTSIKFYFKEKDDRERIDELEHYTLEQQLNNLKAQLGPHFFMNTLNNILVLVQKDPHKAQKSIVLLSRMMRYLLYDGNNSFIPLNKETAFIKCFIELRQLCYTDNVHINVELPQEEENYRIPPLLFYTFVGNAFKHGITYQKPCYINVKIETGSTIHLHCSNSKAAKTTENKNGIGLRNIKQRLELIYPQQYSLNIQDKADTYEVDLQIPKDVYMPYTTETKRES